MLFKFKLGVIIHMKNKMEQKSGDNSKQFQANMMVINQGIEEKRAREIFMEMFKESSKSFSLEAIEKAEDRVRKFEEDLIPRMQKIEGALEAFADPSFQVMLTSANKTAAITTNENDYSLLSELLIHRIKKGNDRKVITGVSKAIEIVNEIPEESLLGLTVLYAWQMIQPQSGCINEGLDVLDNLFSKLMYDNLPKGNDWIEQLDVLNAIRIADASKLKKLEEYYSELMDGYCCFGIKKDSENYIKAQRLLKVIGISDILVKNELDNKFVRLAIVNKTQINNIYKVVTNTVTGITTKILLKENEKNVIEQIYNMYEKNDLEMIKEKFIEEIDKRKNLKRLRNWINNIQISYYMTPIGKVLAHANAQRCDESFPPLN